MNAPATIVQETGRDHPPSIAHRFDCCIGKHTAVLVFVADWIGRLAEEPGLPICPAELRVAAIRIRTEVASLGQLIEYVIAWGHGDIRGDGPIADTVGSKVEDIVERLRTVAEKLAYTATGPINSFNVAVSEALWGAVYVLEEITREGALERDVEDVFGDRAERGIDE